MLIKKGGRVKIENSKSSIAYEYPFGDEKINTALVEINGRYPESGYVVNTVVREISFVLKGNGKIVIDGEEHKLGEQDVVLILPNQKYFFDGKLTLVVSASPAWYPEQHKNC